MKTMMISEFGEPSVLRAYEVDRPALTRKDHVLIRCIAAGINPLDTMKREGELTAFYGRKLPMELGNDVVGEVVETANPDSRFRPGDIVYAMVDSGTSSPLTGFAGGAAYAEYCVTREYTLAKVPEVGNTAHLAAVPLATLTALQGLIKCDYRNKRTLLLNGASGGVGLYALQLAASEGMRVDTISNERSFELLRQLGARNCYSYKDARKPYFENTYDIVFDAALTMKFGDVRKIVEPGGYFLSNVASVSSLLGAVIGKIGRVYKGWKTGTYNWVRPNGERLREIAGLIETGRVRPIVDKEFPLSEAAAAHEYVENNSVIGKVILNCA